MFSRLILGLVPRSLRAAIALVAMLAATGWLTSGLSELVMPSADISSSLSLTAGSTSQPAASSTPASHVTWKLLVGLLVGLPATILFYYYQRMDGEKRADKGVNELEILNSYMEQQNRDQAAKIQAHATPVFNNQGGEQQLGPPSATPNGNPEKTPADTSSQADIQDAQ